MFYFRVSVPISIILSLKYLLKASYYPIQNKINNNVQNSSTVGNPPNCLESKYMNTSNSIGLCYLLATNYSGC